MAFFNEFPHTRTYDNDLGWIIKKVKELDINLQNFIKLNTVKYADPIQWDITKQYEANTVVIDALTGVAYISVQPVPSGVNINNTDYWTAVFTLDLINLNKNITLRNDGDNHNATFESVVGDWVIVGGRLYRVIQDIGLHTAYVIGFNIEIYTVELFVRDYLNQVLTMIGDLQNLNTTDKTSIVNAINEIMTVISTMIGDLQNLNTTDKTSIVNAINEIMTVISTRVINPLAFGCKGDGVTDDTVNLNKYFKYCSDNGYDCDGLGLKYLITNSDAENTLQLHYGAYVKGGRHITNFNFILPDNAPRGLCCLMIDYDENPISIDHCSFSGGIYPSNTGAEDGGNHAIFINNNSLVDLFPDDWQSYGDVYINNCTFNDTWSYSIFPTPLDGTLKITNCTFKDARTCAILPYATNIIIDSCEFNLASHEHTLLSTMCDMEIERFNNANVGNKLIYLSVTNCNTHTNHVYRDTHIGKWAYNKIYIANNIGSSAFVHVIDTGGQLEAWHVYIDNNYFISTGDEPIHLLNVKGDINISNCRFVDYMVLNVTGNINFTDCVFGSEIYFDDCNISTMNIEKCMFIASAGGGGTGAFTAIRDASPVQWGVLTMEDCIIDRDSPIFAKCCFSTYHINNCSSPYKITKLGFQLDLFSANMYIDNLYVGGTYGAYEYLTVIDGNAIITNSKFAANSPTVATGKVYKYNNLYGNNKPDTNIASSIDLKSYNTVSNKYTFPDDGYVLVSVDAKAGDIAECTYYLSGNDDATSFSVLEKFDHDYTYSATYVKKGTKFYITNITSDIACVYYQVYDND